MNGPIWSALALPQGGGKLSLLHGHTSASPILTLDTGQASPPAYSSTIVLSIIYYEYRRIFKIKLYSSSQGANIPPQQYGAFEYGRYYCGSQKQDMVSKKLIILHHQYSLLIANIYWNNTKKYRQSSFLTFTVTETLQSC